MREGEVWCSYGKVRLSVSEKLRSEELQRLKFVINARRKQGEVGYFSSVPVAFFIWKLIDYTVVTVLRDQEFRDLVEEKVLQFHKDKDAVCQKLRELVYNPQLAQVMPKKTGNSKAYWR